MTYVSFALSNGKSYLTLNDSTVSAPEDKLVNRNVSVSFELFQYSMHVDKQVALTQLVLYSTYSVVEQSFYDRLSGCFAYL